MSTKTIKNLIKKAQLELYTQEYTPKSAKAIEFAWREFSDFCEAEGHVRYSPKLKEEFVESLRNRVRQLDPKTIRRKVSSVAMLESIAQSGSWQKGAPHRLPALHGEFAEFLEKQDTLLIKQGHSERTRTTSRQFCERAIRFFQRNGAIKFSVINGEHISAYLLSLKGHAKSTVRGELSRLRIMLTNLYLMEYVTDNLASHVPKYNLGQSHSLLKIWQSSEIGKLLETVDKSSPKGKRDAAYIVIAAELGMRSGDIRNLKLADIDWDACTISFAQRKTGKVNVLPLNEKVGTAIIDYLRVRPETDCDYLFVKLIPPYDQMCSFNTSFQKYVHRAGVTIPKDAHHGLHSLRATVATKLLAANVSPDVIFPFLGHSDRDTLGSYLRFDIENLRDCALEFEDGELI